VWQNLCGELTKEVMPSHSPPRASSRKPECSPEQHFANCTTQCTTYNISFAFPPPPSPNKNSVLGKMTCLKRETANYGDSGAKRTVPTAPLGDSRRGESHRHLGRKKGAETTIAQDQTLKIEKKQRMEARRKKKERPE